MMRTIQTSRSRDTSTIQKTLKVSFGSLWSPGRALEVGKAMRDLMADWKKWTSEERLLAMVLTLLLIGLPVRTLIAAAPL